jgi:diguanylate cyclase (GGDEF)-like protein
MMDDLIIIILLISSILFELSGKRRWTYGSAGLLGGCWVLTQGIPSNVFIFKAVFLGLIWIVFIFLARLIRIIHLKKLTSLEQQILQKKEGLNTLMTSDQTLQDESKILENSLLQKEGLYESLKELNKTLEFPKTVEVFSKLASTLTNFEKGWLLPAPSLETSDRPTCYQLFRSRSPVPHKKFPEEVLNARQREVYILSLKSKSLLFFNNPEEDPRLSEKGTSLGTSTLTGIGLFHEEAPLGVLILEGCKKRDLESLEILAIQLSMETEKDHLYEKVKNLSIIDGLTQTYQKRHLMTLLSEELQRLKSQGKKCSLLMVDIDHFKEFNDNFGHLVGDILLKELSLSIQENLRPLDLVGRFGGEEFLIALPETTQNEAMQIGERIRHNIQFRNFVIHDKLFKLTLSIGISNYPDQSQDLPQLIEMADEALYKAKHSGRNQVVTYWHEQRKN